MRQYFKQQHLEHFSNKPPIFQQDVESLPSPVPVKGWDAISPLSNMEPDYAVILDNCVARPGWVELRGGYVTWADASEMQGGAVDTLMVYRPDNGAEALFVASGDDIYNASAFEAPVITSVTGLNSGVLQYINFTPAGGTTYLIFVNGVDVGKKWNGTTWSDFTVTGLNTSNVINIWTHKRRIWLVEDDSSSVWFLTTDAITGTVSELELGSFLTKGGFIVAIGTWTIDGGNGPDDYFIAVSNKGQAVVYKGTDPSNANAWFLVGVFDLPPPLGFKCFTKMGSELLYISLEGLLPISKALPFDPSGARSVALTNRIQNAMSLAAQLGRNTHGWEVKLFPLQTLLVMNVPVLGGTENQQFVMNTLTGAWSRFTGWNANSFEVFNESLYFGDDDGNVNLAYAGGTDDGDPIVMDMKCAFNYYNDPGRVKVIQMIKPFMVASGNVSPSFRIDVDFGDQNFLPLVTSITQIGFLWDDATSKWDTALWGEATQIFNDWQSIGALGTALAIRAKLNLLVETGSTPQVSGQDVPIVRFNQYQVILEKGAAIG